MLDEIPDATWERNLEVPETASTFRALFADHVEAVPNDALYYRLTPKPGGRAALERLARNERRDEVWALFADFAGKVVSDHWEVHVLQAQWARMVDGDGERLLAFAVLEPSVFAGYRSVTVMGACFEESLLARLWAGKVRFVEREGIANGLRYREHANGGVLDIRYLFDADSSKRARDGAIEVGDGRRVPVREYVRDTVHVTPCASSRRRTRSMVREQTASALPNQCPIPSRIFRECSLGSSAKTIVLTGFES